MKYYLPFLMIYLSINVLNAQKQIIVDTFKVNVNDLDARVLNPKKDRNGALCAIIKVITKQSGFTWDSDMLGIDSTCYKNGAYWLYVPQGAQRLSIFHPELEDLRNYEYPIPIEKATVYEMILKTGKVTRTIVENIPNQYLVITTDPTDASVFIDDEFAGKGNYEAKMKPGSHTYRVEAPLYVTEAGKVVISDSKKEIAVKLKPNFGTIEVTTSPEQGAAVFIDGKNIFQTTPCKSEALLVGEHKVTIEKEWFQPETKMAKVSVGQTTTVDFTLKPTFAEVTFKLPEGASLYVDGDKKQTGNGKVRLKKGIHSVEARHESHHPEMKDIDVVAGEDQTVTLQPVPIYGSLDVESNPSGATITLNGVVKERTPQTFNNLLIGEYQVKLERKDYITVNKSITIEEGKNTIFKGNLNKIPPIPYVPPVETGGKSSAGKISAGNITNYSNEYYKYKKSKTIWLVSALVTGAAGTFTYLQAGSTYEKYKTTAGNEATDLIKKVDLYNLVSPIAFGIAGFSALEFILKSGKQKKAKSKSNGHSMNLFPVPIKNGAGVGLAVQF